MFVNKIKLYLIFFFVNINFACCPDINSTEEEIKPPRKKAPSSFFLPPIATSPQLGSSSAASHNCTPLTEMSDEANNRKIKPAFTRIGTIIQDGEMRPHTPTEDDVSSMAYRKPFFTPSSRSFASNNVKSDRAVDKDEKSPIKFPSITQSVSGTKPPSFLPGLALSFLDEERTAQSYSTNLLNSSKDAATIETPGGMVLNPKFRPQKLSEDR